MGNLFARLLGDGLSEAEKATPFPVQEFLTLSVLILSSVFAIKLTIKFSELL